MGLLIFAIIGYLINGSTGAAWAIGIFITLWLIGYQVAFMVIGFTGILGLFLFPFIYFLSQGETLGAVIIKGLMCIGILYWAWVAQVYFRLRLRGVSHSKAYKWIGRYLAILVLTFLSAPSRADSTSAIAGNIKLPSKTTEAIKACQNKPGSTGDVRDCLRSLSDEWDQSFLKSIEKLNKTVIKYQRAHGKNKALPSEIISARDFGKKIKDEASRVINFSCDAEATNEYRNGSGYPIAYDICFISLIYIYHELVKQKIEMVEETSHD